MIPHLTDVVVGQTMMPGGMIDADDLEGLVEGLAARKPVVASILASQPLRDFHISSSFLEQRKRKASETEQPSQCPDEEECPDIYVIGDTIAPYTTVNNQNGKGICFLGHIHLAPLVRRKTKPQKKLVPLIEPDICNYVEMDFLPQTILRVNGNVPNVHTSPKPQTPASLPASDPLPSSPVASDTTSNAT